MPSMPRGVDPLILQRAAREFADEKLADHKYVMVLHDHQANPHVHISVRAESKHGKRLNPRKTDLHRWRETFAQELRGWRIGAEATRQATRGDSEVSRRYGASRQGKEGRERTPLAVRPPKVTVFRVRALEAWRQVARALEASGDKEDEQLASEVIRFAREAPSATRLQAEAHKAPARSRPLDNGLTR